MSKTTQQTQVALSEELLILQELGFCDLDDPDSRTVLSNKQEREKATHTEMRILDAVAVSLVTGEKGDVIAVALDKQKEVTLVLAKNRQVQRADTTRAKAFVSAIQHARSWADMLPFLAQYSEININKRIERLHQSFVELDSDIQSVLPNYAFSSVEIEFPNSEVYRKHRFSNQWTPSLMLRHLLEVCITQSSTLQMSKDISSHDRYIELYGAAKMLWESSFLQHLTLRQESQWQMEKLKRRLGKVCQYSKLDRLIHMAQGKILPFYWVENKLEGTGERKIKISPNPQDVVARVWEKTPWLPVPNLSADVLTQHPSFNDDWKHKTNVATCVHAELRIILHLSKPYLSGSLPIKAGQQLPIGCSKRSCLCCLLWMDAFNRATTMKWMTAGSHGKPYATWALPGAAGEIKRITDWENIENDVIRGIRERLINKVHILIETAPRRISDEATSSGSDRSSTEIPEDPAVGRLWEARRPRLA